MNLREENSESPGGPAVLLREHWYCCDPDWTDQANFDTSTPFDYKIALPGDTVLRMNSRLRGDRFTDVDETRCFALDDLRC